MTESQRRKNLANVPAEEFIGRTQELDVLLRHAKSENSNKGFLLLSAPSSGASELLKQIYDQLFYENGEIIPIYFSVKAGDQSVAHSVLRFLHDFLTQIVAFRRQDAGINNFVGDITELNEIALPSDGVWLDRLVETYQSENYPNDEKTLIRQALGAPLRAAAHGVKTFVMIDDLHVCAHFSEETNFIEEIQDVFSRADIPFVLSGRRRFLFGKNKENYESLLLSPLSFSDAGLLAETLAEKYDVKINDQTRDLIATQFQGNPAFIEYLVKSASQNGGSLESFQRVQQIYTNELFGGRISKHFERVFEEISPNAETQRNILGLLYDSITLEKEKTPIDSWQNRVGYNGTNFYRTMNFLNANEMIRVTTNMVEAMSDNEVLNDYVTARFRLEIMSENRALTVGEMLSLFLKRAPLLMSKYYRRNSAIGLRELLTVFNCQQIPVSLIDYSRFRADLKGATDEEIFKALKDETEKIDLPQIVYTANTVAFYPQIQHTIEKERSAVALGFQKCNYTDEDETVWIAAEIDSKLEANKELTEFWCDRLEIVALMCNFLNYKIWLVAPEGFSPEAVEVLKNRNAFGSSRKQIELLIDYLGAKNVLGEKLKANEYEMVVPMGEDTEMIAAQTVEEIARRHSFAPRAINQIKTALVEACINATEHSLSPDRKIYQKFSVENDKIVITISNRGLRLNNKKSHEINPDEGRRGWGLKLMKTLMDDVKFEQMDDGTRISMTKYLQN